MFRRIQEPQEIFLKENFKVSQKMQIDPLQIEQGFKLLPNQSQIFLRKF